MATNDQFLKFLNLARQYPAYYLPLIQKQLNSFVNQKELPLAEGFLYDTNQGKTAWEDARAFLLNQKSLPPFLKHSGLCRSASEHSDDLCQNGIFGHKGSDGSTFSQRILKNCKKGPGAMAQIIGADFDLKDRNTAEMTILSLIIDDGVKDRGHRKTIFSPNYKYVGWSTGKQQQKFITVFNMTQNNLQTLFINKNQNSFSGMTPKNFNNMKSSIQAHTKRNHSINLQNSVRQITNNFVLTAPDWKNNDLILTNGSNISQISKLGHRKGKKITQKRQNIRTFYQQGAKVIQTNTKFIYNDGSIEQNTDRRTLYLDQ